MVNPTDIGCICLDVITCLGYASHEINIRREANIKHCLTPDVKEICAQNEMTRSELIKDYFKEAVKDTKQTSIIAASSESQSRGRSTSDKFPKDSP